MKKGDRIRFADYLWIEQKVVNDLNCEKELVAGIGKTGTVMKVLDYKTVVHFDGYQRWTHLPHQDYDMSKMELLRPEEDDKVGEVISKAKKMYDEIWDIFNEHGGYDYNDEMYYHCLGASQSFQECEEDNDGWEALIKHEFEPCLKYMRHIKKIRILQESMPSEVYC